MGDKGQNYVLFEPNLTYNLDPNLISTLVTSKLVTFYFEPCNYEVVTFRFSYLKINLNFTKYWDLLVLRTGVQIIQ